MEIKTEYHIGQTLYYIHNKELVRMVVGAVRATTTKNVPRKRTEYSSDTYGATDDWIEERSLYPTSLRAMRSMFMNDRDYNTWKREVTEELTNEI